jgi:hypothetical protein
VSISVCRSLGDAKVLDTARPRKGRAMDKMEALGLIYATAMTILSMLLAWVIYPPLVKAIEKIGHRFTR